MKFIPLLFANMTRKKIRSVLTVASFSVALFLFGLLAAIHYAFYQGIEVAGVDRLVVRNKISLIMPLPVSYLERIKQTEGVTLVTHASWFGGIYQDKRNFFPQFAVEVDTYRDMFPEFIVPDDQWQAFLKDRQGCIVGKSLVDRFGWKLGDRIPLQSSIYQGTWEFNLCGIYTGRKKSDDISQFWFHYKYLDEKTPFEKGYVGWYTVRIDNTDNAERVAQAIDNRFANSPFESITETERAFAAGFAKQFGNIKLILTSVGGVVFFTLMLITGSNMSLSVRERTNEIAVMKTLGFGNIRVMVLILIESLSYSLIGAFIGLGLCKLFTMSGDPTGGFLPTFYLAPSTMVLGGIISICVGIISGLVPSLTAMNLKIVDAMRRI